MRLAAVILAGGYGTRIAPIIGDFPKCLLRFGGKPLLCRLCEKVAQVSEVNQVVIRTNRRFQEVIRQELREQEISGVDISADNSLREKDKPGALRSLGALLPEVRGSDVIVLAGDNLFTEELNPMVKLYRGLRATLVGVYAIDTPELVKQYSRVVIDPVRRAILRFEEKPADPTPSLVGTGVYIFPRRVLERLPEYFDIDGNPDSPGHFLSWLVGREPLFAYQLTGAWYDVGNPETYRAALERFGSGR